MKESKKLNKNAFYIRALLLILLIILWESGARLNWFNPFFTSYPSEILIDLYEFTVSGDLWYHASITLTEAVLGLIIGVVLGLAIGMLLAQFKLLGRIITPIFSGINTIPQLALAPIYVLWFGLGLTSKVFLAALMCFFNVFFQTYNSIRSTDQQLIESAHILGATRYETLIHIVVPSCMPYILSGIRSGISASMVGAIIGEYLGAAGGFGWMITYATSYFMIRRVMSSILILLLFGLVLNKILDLVEERVLIWYEETSLTGNI